VRRNIRRGRSGTPLTLRLRVVDANTCRAIPNAAVEIWHCDALGEYSGVEGNGGTFLRGIQRADSRGRVRFETIVPGWYRGRTPHIHMKVFVSGDEVHTGQVFFRSRMLRAVYAQGVYASRGDADTTNATDGIYSSAGARALVPTKRKGARVSTGYTGALVLGVDPS
jgi:protocatechuate 3,4-dioxygenase beta subunit